MCLGILVLYWWFVAICQRCHRWQNSEKNGNCISIATCSWKYWTCHYVKVPWSERRPPRFCLRSRDQSCCSQKVYLRTCRHRRQTEVDSVYLPNQGSLSIYFVTINFIEIRCPIKIIGSEQRVRIKRSLVMIENLNISHKCNIENCAEVTD